MFITILEVAVGVCAVVAALTLAISQICLAVEKWRNKL